MLGASRNAWDSRQLELFGNESAPGVATLK